MQKLVLKDGVFYLMDNGVSVSDAITVLNRILIHLNKKFYILYADVYASQAAFDDGHNAIDSFSLTLTFAQVKGIETQLGVSFLVADDEGGEKINDLVMPMLLMMPNPDDSINEVIGQRWEIG